MAESGYKLHACATHLPSSGSGSFVEIYDLGSGTVEPVSITALNDRAVIACGNMHKPLVFCGGLDPEGADWAVPRAALISYDSGVSWHDIGDKVLDSDSGTSVGLTNFTANSGMIAICTDVSGISGFMFEASGNLTSGVIKVEVYSGAWGDWTETDGTAYAGRTFYQSGVVTPDALSVATYHTIYEVPGYWHRVSFPSGLSSPCTLKRILFQAPCQDLQVIGDGQPVMPTQFLYYDDSAANAQDWTAYVIDYTHPSYAKLNDGAASGAVGMVSGNDRIYIGYLEKFDEIEIMPENTHFNTSGASGIWEYWNGTTWTSLSVTDGTAVSGAVFAQKGRITFSAPEDWRESRAINHQYPRLYWLRMGVSADLLVETYISECYLWPVPTAMVNYKFAATQRDRVVLGNRPDARDQLAISRAYEEYGMTGADSSALRVGGQDELVSMTELFNNIFLGKPNEFYILNGYDPKTFAAERAETGGQGPINNRCVVSAAVAEADSKNKQGIYFLNHFGAWCFTGLQTYELSKEVNWWNPAADNPRIDLNYLYDCCGVYWPERQWILWSVPLITGENSSQTTNNAILIYDLTLQTFLPPRMQAVASLCTAFHYAADAPGHRGEIGLYAGDYSGGISRIFGPTADYTSGWGETGWLAFGAPKIKKNLRHLTAYGKGDITVTAYVEGTTASGAKTWTFSGLSGVSTAFAVDQDNANLDARFYKFKVSLGSGADLYGLGLEFSPVRGWNWKI